MKNQYFGDRRDFFKYDLLLDLVEGHGSRKLTFIPMLTPNDGSAEGTLTHYDCGERRQSLCEFLQAAVTSRQRDIRLLHQIMPQFQVEFRCHCDNHYLLNQDRDRYFDSLPPEWLAESVVFLDPDIGLQTGNNGYMRRKGFEKYLTYAELSRVCSRTSGSSVVIVYQHLQRNAKRHLSDLEHRLEDLRAHIPAAGLWAIRQGDLAFLILIQDRMRARQIEHSLATHARRHGLQLIQTPASSCSLDAKLSELSISVPSNQVR